MVKNWIYDWFMAVDVAKRYKQDQLEQLLQLTKVIFVLFLGYFGVQVKNFLN